MPFKLIAATTYCLHPSLSFVVSSAFLIPNNVRSSFILSTHLCLGRPLSLFVFGFHVVICSISSSDLYTRPAQLICILVKVPTMLGLLHSYSKFSCFVFHILLHHFFFLVRIFSFVSFSQTLLTFFHLIFSWPKYCIDTKSLVN